VAMAMARLSPPNVARVFDVGSNDSRLLIAMEFIRGQTLRAWLAEQPRSWREVREVFLAAGHGLAAAHHEGIVHRDFKPDNVLIDEEGRARVVDFGLAIPADESVRTADQDELVTTVEPDGTGGTPAYMAPEQHIGCPADARADQYSFCVALFEALYGRRPFLGRTWQTLSPQVLRGGLETLAAARRVPPHVRRVVLRGLSSAPGRRYPDMDVLLAELAHEPAPAPSRMPRHLLLGAAALGLTAALVVYSMPAAGPALAASAPTEPTPSSTPARDRQDLQVDALLGQLRLARMLRRSDRRSEALDLLRAVTDAAEQTLGRDHGLSIEARSERDQLANELADQPRPR